LGVGRRVREVVHELDHARHKGQLCRQRRGLEGKCKGGHVILLVAHRVYSECLPCYWSHIGNILSPWLPIGRPRTWEGAGSAPGGRCSSCAARFVNVVTNFLPASVADRGSREDTTRARPCTTAWRSSRLGPGGSGCETEGRGGKHCSVASMRGARVAGSCS
jgi:hypothetical protein